MLNINRAIFGGDGRSKQARRQILLSLLSKGISVLVSLMIVPMTISYVNPTQYGIWLTLSSIISWITFFNLGLGNGMRNKYAQAKAHGNMILACQYLSTTYFSVSVVVFLLMVISYVVNIYIDWTAILNVDVSYKEELHDVFGIVSTFVCLNMVVNLFDSFLSADQRPGVASVIHGIGQLVSLCVIYTLTKLTKGSLYNLALYYSGIQCLVMLIASLYGFIFTKYRRVRPRIAFIKVSLIKNLLGLGLKFFVIYLCMIAIFQVINIVLSREIGPDAVVEYNVAYKYFNILYMLMIIVVTPFWTAFTDANAKGDIEWMKKTVRTLEKYWFLSIVCAIMMFAISPIFIKLWVGDSVSIPVYLLFYVMLYVLIQIIANIYMYIINGIGTITIQLIIYLFFAILSWPLLIFLSKTIGIVGVLILPSLVYLLQAIFAKIQISKIINNRAKGLWLK